VDKICDQKDSASTPVLFVHLRQGGLAWDVETAGRTESEHRKVVREVGGKAVDGHERWPPLQNEGENRMLYPAEEIKGRYPKLRCKLALTCNYAELTRLIPLRK
jgi:hypothetical protein